ncbi:MAG: transglycosylase domain-containing protein [Bifidobacteriaceae bacterium]|jgi:membrane peptidoglycan carboxypeptidase|nr:transglycosylase domain-containing protein [Bifidobacteriaceae bacterium]
MSKGTLALRAAGKWVAGTSAFVLVAGALGVLGSALVLPAVGVASFATDTGLKVLQSVPAELVAPELPQKSYIYASDGRLLTTYYAQNRVVVALDEISEPMQNAVIALEDRRFWEHSGVDMQGMIRAFINNSIQDDEVQGASTLTQQYVKNALIQKGIREGDDQAAKAATDFSYARKLREAKMAVALEKEYGKPKVLEGYLNIAQFGPSLYGVEAAANYYFGTSAAELTPLQAATIAGITQKPNGLDPENFPKENMERRNATLAAMLRDGYITKEEHDEAVAVDVTESLNITPVKSGCESADEVFNAGFFCDYVVAEIRNSEALGKTVAEREQALTMGGLHITTSINLDWQAKALVALESKVPINDSSGVGNALSAVEPGTGYIRAMAQNRHFKSEASDDPTYTSVNYNVDKQYGGSSGFQPGSTFKPFILAAWLEAGHSLQEPFDASTTVYRPAHFKASCVEAGWVGAPEWRVRGSGAAKNMTAYAATVGSYNPAYAAMEYKLDMCAIQDLLERLGVKRADGTDWHLIPSMVLGSNEVSPLTMAGAYATFASGGIYCPPTAIEAITDADGNPIDIPKPACQRVISEGVANGVSSALSRAVAYGTGTRARLDGGRPVAGKTGTTDQSKAAWFCGYTPHLATAVWNGHPGESKDLKGWIGGTYYSGAFGGDLGAPVFKVFMEAAMADLPKTGFGSVPSEVERGRQVRVPSVLGMSEQAAKQRLESEGFSMDTGQPVESTAYGVGAVAEQSPSGWAYPGTTITVRLSSGPPSIVLPNPNVTSPG